MKRRVVRASGKVGSLTVSGNRTWSRGCITTLGCHRFVLIFKSFRVPLSPPVFLCDDTNVFSITHDFFRNPKGLIYLSAFGYGVMVTVTITSGQPLESHQVWGMPWWSKHEYTLLILLSQHIFLQQHKPLSCRARETLYTPSQGHPRWVAGGQHAGLTPLRSPTSSFGFARTAGKLWICIVGTANDYSQPFNIVDLEVVPDCMVRVSRR